MATISTLAVNLIARTSAFEKGMNRGRKSVKGLKASISGAIGKVASFAKRLALIAGVGAMGFFVKTTLKSLDAVAKLSRRIGIATEELLGLRHAAELAGVSNQALDKSLEIFVRRMGEVKSGSGEATRGLEALGLSAERMIAVTPEKALLIVADRIQQLGTQAEKSAAAYFLFGRAGAQLLNLFEDGAAGIERAQKEAEKLDLTLKGFDLTKVEAANDAMMKFKSSMKAVFIQAVIRLTPAIKKLADFMTKYRDAILGSIKKTVIFAAKAFIMVKAIKLVVGAVKLIITAYKILAARQITFLALAGPAGWATLAASIGIATAAIIGMNAGINDAVGGIKDLVTESVKLKDIGKDPVTLASIDKSIALQKKRIADAVGFDPAGQFVPDRFIIQDARIKIVLLDRQRDILQAQLNITQQQKRLADNIAAKEAERLRLAGLQKTAFKSVSDFANKLRESFENLDQGIKPLERQLINLKKLGRSLTGEASVLFDKDIANAEKLLSDFFKLQELSKEKPGDRTTGRFQEIRSEFIDVAALSGGDNAAVRQNRLTEQTNEILRDIKSQNAGTAQL